MTDAELQKVSPNDAIAEKRAANIYEQIAQTKIDSVESYVLVGDLLKQVKKLLNTFEEETRPEIEQAHKLHKALIARRDRWADKFAEAEELAKEKLKHFADANAVPQIEGVSYAETWVGSVVDDALIPREYLMPDLKKLAAVTKAMKKETNIPGWKATAAKTISVRS